MQGQLPRADVSRLAVFELGVDRAGGRPNGGAAPSVLLRSPIRLAPAGRERVESAAAEPEAVDASGKSVPGQPVGISDPSREPAPLGIAELGIRIVAVGRGSLGFHERFQFRQGGDMPSRRAESLGPLFLGSVHRGRPLVEQAMRWRQVAVFPIAIDIGGAPVHRMVGRLPIGTPPFVGLEDGEFGYRGPVPVFGGPEIALGPALSADRNGGILVVFHVVDFGGFADGSFRGRRSADRRSGSSGDDRLS